MSPRGISGGMDEKNVATAITEHDPYSRREAPTESPAPQRAASDALLRAFIEASIQLEAVVESSPEVSSRIQHALSRVTDARIALLVSLGPRTHRLKTDPLPFAEIIAGRKLYEVRPFDRDYHVGDTLVLLEFDREMSRYSGRKVSVIVTTITAPGTYGLPMGIGVMGIAVITPPSVPTDPRGSVESES